MLFLLSTVYYAWMAYKLAREETGRTDVCALPSGISVPHMFVVTFVIMLPIALKTGDPIKGWEAGLTWVFIQSFVLMLGGFVAPYHSKDHAASRAAWHAGRGINRVYFHAAGARNVHDSAHRHSVFCHHPAELVRRGALLQRNSGRSGGDCGRLPDGGLGFQPAFGLNYGGMSLTKSCMNNSVSNFGFTLPVPAFDHVFSGFEFLGVILVTAIPFGIYDLVEALDNVESAAVAGDSFPTTRVLTADGVVSLIGCLHG